jgi:AraC-like DNA-binding protein
MPTRLQDVSIYTWRTTAMLLFRGAVSPRHEHITTQFSLSVDGSSRVRTEGSEWRSAAGILVPQGLAHEYDATVGGLHLVVWIEPESLAGRAIRSRYAGDQIHAFTDEQLGDLRSEVRALLVDTSGPTGARRVRARVIETLTGEQPRTATGLDARLERAIAVMFEHRAEDLSVSQLASRVGMSESSLSHLFREHIGVPVSRYRMWLRALEAARILQQAPTITDVAHAAGFSDAAHLTRTFRQLFGQTPSAFLGGSVQVCVMDAD